MESTFRETIVGKSAVRLTLDSGAIPHYVLVREHGHYLAQERWRACLKSLVLLTGKISEECVLVLL